MRIVVGVLAAACVLAQIAGTHAFPGNLWGFHFYRFFPSWFGVAAWIAVAGLGFVLLGGGRLGERLVGAVRRAAAAVAARPVPFALLLAVACGTAFWTLRSRQMILGDAMPLVEELARGGGFHQRQPLTMAAQQLAFRGLGDEDPRIAVALTSVACGVLFSLAAWGIGRELSPGRSDDDRAARVLVTLALLAQGYAALFFGYVENYSFVAVALAGYTLTGLLHVRGRAPLAIPLLALTLAIGLHLSSIVVVPSAVVLVVRAWRRNGAGATVASLGVAAAGVVALDLLLRRMDDGYSLPGAIAHIVRIGSADPPGETRWEYLFSLRHVRDLVNEQALIGPLGSLLLVPAAIVAARRGVLREPPIVFLLVVSGLVLGASAATPDPALGYARDWDLFAPSGVPMSIAALALVVRVARPAGALPLLVLGCALSAASLLPWVLVNRSDERSVARMKLLPLGWGREEVVVANWYRRHGDDEQAIEWFHRALEANPTNPNPYALLGALHGQRGEMAQAIPLLERAVAMRPDKIGYRRNLVTALRSEGRWEELLPHVETLCGAEPGDVQHWIGWRQALLESGRPVEEVKRMGRLGYAALEEHHGRQPDTVQPHLDLALLASFAQEHELALRHYRAALAIEPGSPPALYGAGRTLVILGRPDEARPVLARLLEVEPGHPARDQVRGWLDFGSRPPGPDP